LHDILTIRMRMMRTRFQSFMLDIVVDSFKVGSCKSSDSSYIGHMSFSMYINDRTVEQKLRMAQSEGERWEMMHDYATPLAVVTAPSVGKSYAEIWWRL